MTGKKNGEKSQPCSIHKIIWKKHGERLQLVFSILVKSMKQKPFGKTRETAFNPILGEGQQAQRFSIDLSSQETTRQSTIGNTKKVETECQETARSSLLLKGASGSPHRTPPSQRHG